MKLYLVREREIPKGKFSLQLLKINHREWFIVVAITVLFTSATLSSLHAQVFKSQEKALAEAFATADTVRRETLFLDEAQQRTIEAAAKMPLSTGIISYYVGEKNGKPYRYVFFEDEVVRTKKAVLMVAIDADAAIESVSVLALYEPMDYLPVARWFNLFTGKTTADAIQPGRDIDGVTGATLSVRTFSGIARRTLAVFAEIKEQSK